MRGIRLCSRHDDKHPPFRCYANVVFIEMYHSAIQHTYSNDGDSGTGADALLQSVRDVMFNVHPQPQ
jgi:hypothetical protein